MSTYCLILLFLNSIFMFMESYRDLKGWKIGLELVREIYRLAKKLPREELYGGASQIKDAVTSILANIAEAGGRYTYKDKASKFVISRGECYETEAFLLIFVELQFLTTQDISHALKLIEEEKKILSGLIAACRKRQSMQSTTTLIH